MLDLAARVSDEIRDPAVLRRLAEQLGLPLAPGRYLFATIHRAENRTAEALAGWAALLGAVASPDRPVVLALHPGTRAALDAAGVALPEGVAVVGPLGYRSSLALQLHAAAVLTDSGGVQRESAWLGVPCLILRSATEWPELVVGTASSAVLVGLDRDVAMSELDLRAPDIRGGEQAAARAANLRLTGSGAAERIAAALTQIIGSHQ
jgi:UDP-N-acetylglucosamine 2-epimerase